VLWLANLYRNGSRRGNRPPESSGNLVLGGQYGSGVLLPRVDPDRTIEMIPGVVGTSSFKDFANQRRISPKVTRATIVAALMAFVAALIFFGKPLSWLYTDAFAAVSPMARVAAFGAVLYGFGDFYNRFMGAHGKGAVLRTRRLWSER